MGSFIGHILPGLCFIIMGLWWAVRIPQRYHQTLHDGKAFQSYIFFPVTFKRKLVKFDSYVLLILCAAGFGAELVFSPLKNGHVGIGNLQHTTMYIAYALITMPEVILSKMDILPRPIIENFTYYLYVIANMIEAMLFQFHLYGKPADDVLLHTLLVYTIYGIVIVTCLEVRNRNNVLFSLGRTLLTILQGTWFFQAAFMLYPLSTDPWGDIHDNRTMQIKHKLANSTLDSSHNDWERSMHLLLMKIACSYVWHLIINLILMTFLTLCLIRKHRGNVKTAWVNDFIVEEDAWLNNNNKNEDGGGLDHYGYDVCLQNEVDNNSYYYNDEKL